MYVQKWKWLLLAFLIASPYGWTKNQPSEPKAYFIVLESEPVLLHQQKLSGGALRKSAPFKAKLAQANRYAKTLAQEKQQIVQQVLSIDEKARIAGRYDRLVNALAVEMDPAKLDRVRDLQGVSFISPIRPMKLALTNSSELMNLPQVYERLDQGERAGEGMLIAIIDTGIDVTHPAFDPTGFSYPPGFPKGNADFTSEKVIAARVFPPRFGEKGDTTLFDRQGHGTNVASIAAANLNVHSPLGLLSGVAPRAYLGNYKVFTNEYTDNDQVVRAIEQAVEDGADVINMSLGSDIFGDPYHDVQIMAVRNAIRLGVPVVIASGNEGGEPFTVGNPAQVDEAITVGSTTNSHTSKGDPSEFDVFVTVFANGKPLLENVQAIVGARGGPYTEPLIGAFRIQDIDLLDGGGYGGLTDGLGCESLGPDQLIEDWVLILRGECTFVSKIENVQQAGARGVLFVDNKDTQDLDWPSVDETTIPAIMIDKESGFAIKNALKNGDEVIVSIEGDTIQDATNLSPNRLSTFSAIGPSVGYSLKPDLVTIGEGSFAGTQNDDTQGEGFNASGFMWLAGTSMAAPRIAGLAAILRQLHPDWPPSWIKSAMTLSAQLPVLKKNGDREALVLERGAGLVDADAATRVDTVVVPSLVGFGAKMVLDSPPEPVWVTVVNVADHPCSYVIQQVDNSDPLDIALSEFRFSLLPKEKKEIQVSIRSIQSLPDGDLQGEITLTNITTSKTYRIPCWVKILSVMEPIGDVLLIDDDGERTSENYYMDRLDDLGIPFTWWDVHAMEIYPTLDYLRKFKTILWFMSDNTLNSIDDENTPEYRRMYNPRHLFEMDTMKYLAEGGTLFQSAQDYSDDKEVAVFSQEVLALNFRDIENGGRTIQGYPTHIFADGLGPFTMKFPSDFENWVDYLTPIDRNRVQRAFIADGSRGKTVGVTVDACTYRIVFLAFPLETLDASSGLTILQKSMEWLWDRGATEPPAVSEISPSKIERSADSDPYTIAIEGNGFVYKKGYQAYLDFIPITNLQRQDCGALTGQVPADIESGTYTLRLVTGDGHTLRLANALTVTGGTETDVWDWALY